MDTTTYREAKRVHTSVLAAAEKRALVWMAPVSYTHLTLPTKA